MNPVALVLQLQKMLSWKLIAEAYQADLSSKDEKRIADSSYMEILER